MKAALVSLVLAVLCAGCGQQSGSGIRIGGSDPKTTFERFAPQFLSELQKVYNETWNAEPPSDRDKQQNQILNQEALYDVRKTDSLVHPYEGIITLSYVYESKFGFKNKMTWELHFGYDNGKWVPTTTFYPKDGTSGRIGSNDSWSKAWQRVQQ